MVEKSRGAAIAGHRYPPSNGGFMSKEWWDAAFEDQPDFWCFDSPEGKAYEMRRFTAIAETVAGLPTQSVWEAAAHEGHLLSVLARRLPDVRLLASDISEIAIDRARQRVPTAQFQTVDLNRIIRGEERKDVWGFVPGVIVLSEVLYFLGPEVDWWRRVTEAHLDFLESLRRRCIVGVVLQHSPVGRYSYVGQSLRDCGAEDVQQDFGVQFLPSLLRG